MLYEFLLNAISCKKYGLNLQNRPRNRLCYKEFLKILMNLIQAVLNSVGHESVKVFRD